MTYGQAEDWTKDWAKEGGWIGKTLPKRGHGTVAAPRQGPCPTIRHHHDCSAQLPQV